MLENVNDVSITTDMWTSDSTRSYITVTCHFIFNDCLYSPVLATEEVKESHTGEILLRHFQTYLMSGIFQIKL